MSKFLRKKTRILSNENNINWCCNRIRELSIEIDKIEKILKGKNDEIKSNKVQKVK